MNGLPIFLVSAALFAQQNPTKPDDLSGIEGQVTNAVTGAPVKKADLLLQLIGRRSNTGAQQTTYSATSDAGGRFTIVDVERGKYRLTASGNGFVRFTYGARGPDRPGTTISLDAGQHLKELNLRVTPQGVITGRIVDEDGDPVAGVSVQAQSYRRNEGGKQLFPAGSASTNDLGEYRIFGLAPGQYYLNATYNQSSYEAMQRDRSAKAPAESYVPSYYPRGIDFAAAAAIEVAPGAELRGINIPLSKAHTVRVRGHVEDVPATQNVSVMLTARDAAGWAGIANRRNLDPQGNFEFRGVRPGEYLLLATSTDGERRLEGRQVISVGDNMENVIVSLRPGMDLAGQIKAEGADGTNLASIFVSLEPYEPGTARFSPAPHDQVKEDGTFAMTQVFEEHYHIHVGNIPDGYYVKSMRAGDQDVLDSGLDVTSGAIGPLIVTVAPGAGDIEGTAQNDKQEPAAGASVVLIPSDAKRRGRRDAYYTATTGQGGRFTVKGIDPGDYKLYAWDDLESGAYMDAGFVKPFESRGVPMSIHENSRETAQLTLIVQ